MPDLHKSTKEFTVNFYRRIFFSSKRENSLLKINLTGKYITLLKI